MMTHVCEEGAVGIDATVEAARSDIETKGRKRKVTVLQTNCKKIEIQKKMQEFLPIARGKV